MAWDSKRRPASEYINQHKAQRILARDGRTCHVCHHAGADQVDHIIPWAEWTRLDLSPHDQSNLAAIHGQPCSVCQSNCHAVKTQQEAARGIARRQAKGKRPPETHPGLL